MLKLYRLLVFMLLGISLLVASSCSNVQGVSNKSESSSGAGNDIIEKSVTSALSVITGINQFDDQDQRFKVNFYNRSSGPVVVREIFFSGPNSSIYRIVNTDNNQCLAGLVVLPGRTCSVAVGVLSSISGEFSGDVIDVTFYTQSNNIGDFNVTVPLHSYVLEGGSKLYMKPLAEGITSYYYDFGRVSVGAIQIQTYKLYNVSGSTKNIHLSSKDLGSFRLIPSLDLNSASVATGLSPCSTSIRTDEVCLVDAIYFPYEEESTQTAIVKASTELDGTGLVAPSLLTGTGSYPLKVIGTTSGNLSSDKNYVMFEKSTASGSISDNPETVIIENTSASQISFNINQLDKFSFHLSGSCIDSKILPAFSSCKLNINFSPIEARRYNDLILITSGNDRIVLPVLSLGVLPPSIPDVKVSYAIYSRTINPSDSNYLPADTSLITYPSILTVGELADKSIYLKFTNSGSSAIYFTANLSSKELNISGNNPNRCLSSIPALSSCVIRLDVLPTISGEGNTILNLQAGSGSYVIPVRLNVEKNDVVAGDLTIDKSSLVLYDTEVGFFSTGKIKIYNESSSSKPISVVMPDFDDVFNITTTCTPNLDMSSSCEVNFLFTPQSVTSYSKDVIINGVTITASGKGVDPYAIDSGTAIAGLSVDSSKLYYTPTEVDAVSKSSKITLTATSAVNLKITSPVMFRYEPDYSTCKLSNDGSLSISTGNSCNIAYSFAPTSIGNIQETLVIKDNSNAGKLVNIKLFSSSMPRSKVNLNGYVISGNADTKAITFANRDNRPIKVASATLRGYSVDKTNGNQTPLTDTTYTISNDGCSGKYINPNESCDVLVKFNTVGSGQYISKLDIELDNGTKKRFINVASTENNVFVPIIPESSYKMLGRPSTAMVSYNNKVYAIGGSNSSHAENNDLKVLNMQEMTWSKVAIDTSTNGFAPDAAYTLTSSSPITLQTIIAKDTTSLRGAKFDVYDGELLVVGGLISNIADFATSGTTPAYGHGKVNFISKIDIKTGKWSAPLRTYEIYQNISTAPASGSVDRLWGDITRIGSLYHIIGGKSLNNGTSTKSTSGARFIYYDFATNNKKAEYQTANTNTYDGNGVSVSKINNSIVLLQGYTGLGSGTLGNNFTAASANLFISRQKCVASGGWQIFGASNSVARLTSGTVPIGNQFSSVMLKNKTTKVNNLFLGTANASNTVTRIAITETNEGADCSNYSASITQLMKSSTNIQPTVVFTYDDRLWAVSGDQLLLFVTTQF